MISARLEHYSYRSKLLSNLKKELLKIIEWFILTRKSENNYLNLSKLDNLYLKNLENILEVFNNDVKYILKKVGWFTKILTKDNNSILFIYSTNEPPHSLKHFQKILKK